MRLYVKAVLFSLFIHLFVFFGYFAYDQYEEYTFQKEQQAITQLYPNSGIVIWRIPDANSSPFPPYFRMTFPVLIAGYLFLNKK
ncbi:MAG: hypothetical protein K0R47_4270 [Brevibacillus sp.]|nr:hypothetical protein [Brevibacillus sp.]